MALTTTTNTALPLVFVGTYTQHDNLAHVPRGRQADYGLYVYRFCQRTGQLVLLTLANDFENPAFLRYHPKKNILYLCTESIDEEGIVGAYKVDTRTGELAPLGHWGAAGTSTCYLTLDKELRHVLAVNYWNSTVAALPIQANGALGQHEHLHKPEKEVKALSREDHLRNRQLEPHAHAIVLERTHGKIAYVPDLGQDVVGQYVYDSATGRLTPAGIVKSSDAEGIQGPRYFEFHPTLPMAYVVNEIASTVAVFEFDLAAAERLASDPASQEPTLRLVQVVDTVPEAFPRKLNTCGRICVDPSGQHVLVSNRGHNSIAAFRVEGDTGLLKPAEFSHTGGSTPRHFQFDASGRWAIVANQDTDCITVFAFDKETGSLAYTGNRYDVPSPNFVCVQTPYAEQAEE